MVRERMEDKVDEFSYIWNWFALHSGQRLQLVNFWLVSVAFLGAAFVQARSGHLDAVALGVSVAGAICSVAFMQLDVRTRRLILVAEEAVQRLGQGYPSDGTPANIVELMRAANKDRRWFSSYRVIIEGLQLSVAVLFGLAAVYSVAWPSR
jgi:hypothetical protein